MINDKKPNELIGILRPADHYLVPLYVMTLSIHNQKVNYDKYISVSSKYGKDRAKKPSLTL